jgi:hypothetical protein
MTHNSAKPFLFVSTFQTTGNAKMMTCICHISLSNKHVMLPIKNVQLDVLLHVSFRSGNTLTANLTFWLTNLTLLKQLLVLKGLKKKKNT